MEREDLMKQMAEKARQELCKLVHSMWNEVEAKNKPMVVNGALLALESAIMKVLGGRLAPNRPRLKCTLLSRDDWHLRAFAADRMETIRDSVAGKEREGYSIDALRVIAVEVICEEAMVLRHCSPRSILDGTAKPCRAKKK